MALWRGLDASVEVSGAHASRIPDTGRDLSFVTLMAGPRLHQAVGRQGRVVLTEHLFVGAARGFDAPFGQQDTATGLSYSAGGGLQWRLSPSIAVRVLEVSLHSMNLPNGADNRQNNLQWNTGVIFRVPTWNWHR